MLKAQARRRGPPMAWLSAALVLALAPRTSRARDNVGTRATGMGEALRASASGYSAPLLNPAGLSLARMYSIAAQYQYRGSDGASMVNATIVDSVTAKVAAGLFYNFTYATPEHVVATPKGGAPVEQTRMTHQVGLALSMPLTQWLLLGASTRYINHQTDVPEDAPDEVTADVSTVTVEAGAIVRPFGGLNLAAVGYNLIPVDPVLFPIQLGLGASYKVSVVTLAFDSIIDFTTDPDGVTASFHGGIEGFFAKRFAVRAGAMHNLFREATYVTGGLGLVLKSIGVDVSLRQEVDGGNETQIAFALQLFVQ